MGASQSELAQYQDEGPAVSEVRILKAIKEHEKTDDVVIEEINEKCGNVKGAGFMGALVQLEVTAMVDARVKNYNWMVKSTPREPNRYLIARKFNLDEREVTFYKGLLPKLKRFAESKNCSDIFPIFCPIPFASWNAEDKVLIMENLVTSGWRDAINKKKGLNIDHVRSAMKWLATFHAITFSFLDQYEGGLEQAKKDLDVFWFKYSAYDDIEDMLMKFRNIANDSLKVLFGTIEKSDPDKQYVKRLEAVLAKHKDMNKAGLFVREKQEYKLQTICHSDPWFNNMMIKYSSNGTLDQSMFIDFQITSYHSPTLDLAYFMTSSTTGQFRRDHLTHVLTYYHTIFMSTVQRLGSTVEYSFEDLENDYKKSYLWGLNFSIGALPSVLAESESDVMEMESIMEAINNPDTEASNEAMSKEVDRNRALFDKNKELMERVKDTLEECIEYGQLELV